MTQEEKQLLLKDLSGRLPYGVKCAVFDDTLPFGGSNGKHPFEMDGISIEEYGIDVWLEKGNFNLKTIKPYLRPISSMTKEEWGEFEKKFEVPLGAGGNATYFKVYDYVVIDFGCRYEMNLSDMADMLSWLYLHHFDINNLIEKGLALEAPEGMYKIE